MQGGAINLAHENVAQFSPSREHLQGMLRSGGAGAANAKCETIYEDMLISPVTTHFVGCRKVIRHTQALESVLELRWAYAANLTAVDFWAQEQCDRGSF
jgi:hypothetical protein